MTIDEYTANRPALNGSEQAWLKKYARQAYLMLYRANVGGSAERRRLFAPRTGCFRTASSEQARSAGHTEKKLWSTRLSYRQSYLLAGLL
jgi:hypothetical protein